MEPKIRIIRPGEPTTEDDRALRWVENLAHLLDSKFAIPGTSIRFGLDPILGLFPVLGDLITYIISGALIYTMHNHGASRKVVIKMIMNSTVDAVFGSIPLVGWIFDVYYRSNDRNVRLLKEHYFEGKHQGSGSGILIIVALLAIVIVVAAIYGTYKLIEAIF